MKDLQSTLLSMHHNTQTRYTFNLQKGLATTGSGDSWIKKVGANTGSTKK